MEGIVFIEWLLILFYFTYIYTFISFLTRSFRKKDTKTPYMMYSPLKIWDRYWVTITKWKKFINYFYLLCWFRPQWNDHCLRCSGHLTSQLPGLLFRRRWLTPSRPILEKLYFFVRNINYLLALTYSSLNPTLQVWIKKWLIY